MGYLMTHFVALSLSLSLHLLEFPFHHHLHVFLRLQDNVSQFGFVHVACFQSMGGYTTMALSASLEFDFLSLVENRALLPVGNPL